MTLIRSEESLKQNVLPPQNPLIKYHPSMNKWQWVALEDDVGISRMFDMFNGTTQIEIFVQESAEPTELVTMARNLRRQQEQRQASNEQQPPPSPPLEPPRTQPQSAPIMKTIVANKSPAKKLKPVKKPHPHPTPQPQLQHTPSPQPQPTLSPQLQPQPQPTTSLQPQSQPTTSLQPQPQLHSTPSPQLQIQPQSIPSTHKTSTRKISRTTLKRKAKEDTFVNVIISSQRSSQASEHALVGSANSSELALVAANTPAHTEAHASAHTEAFACREGRKARRAALIDTTTTPTDDIEGEIDSTDDEWVERDVLGNDYDEVSLDDENEEDSNLSDEVNDGYNYLRDHDRIVEDETSGGYFDNLYNNGDMYVEEEFGDIKIEVWNLFQDREHFLRVLRDYCIQEGFDLLRIKVEKGRFTGVCATEGCDWRIHASVLPDGITWGVKTLSNQPHTCSSMEKNPMANGKWIAEKMIDDIRANPQIPVSSLKDLCYERYGVVIATSTMYKVKARAIKEIEGAHDESYAYLPGYCEVIKLTNPDSHAFISWRAYGPEQPLQFSRLFISFEAQYKGFINGCRPLIGVDGCHLKGNYGGVLLSAIAFDGNNELFPIAYAVVSEESTDSWRYFFTLLKIALKDYNNNHLTFMSDRQKGVEIALSEVWPTAARRICSRHLYANFKVDFGGRWFRAYFWRCAHAYSEFVFKKAIEKIAEKSRAAYNYLKNVDFQLWCRHKFDTEVCCDANTNNFVESFNNTLGVDRTKPVLTLLEGIRRGCMGRLCTRRGDAEKWDSNGIYANIAFMLKKIIVESRSCKVTESGRGEYEIKEGRSSFPINLATRSCICGVWQLTGIPCKHAVRAIHEKGDDPVQYCSPYYSVELYKKVYDKIIHPMPDREQWPQFDLPSILPPPLKRSIGRPSRNRRREPGEKRKGRRSTTVQCQKCKGFGHNMKTCKGGPTAKEKRTSTTTTSSSSIAPASGTITTKKRKTMDVGDSSSKKKKDKET